jgi:hypothetical protein
VNERHEPCNDDGPVPDFTLWERETDEDIRAVLQQAQQRALNEQEMKLMQWATGVHL